MFAALVLEPFVTAKGMVPDSEGTATSKVRIIYHRDLAGEFMGHKLYKRQNRRGIKMRENWLLAIILLVQVQFMLHTANAINEPCSLIVIGSVPKAW